MKFNGLRLRTTRRFLGFSQRDLADRVGVTHPLIGDFERGAKEPKGIMLDALSAVLLTENGFFFEHDEDEFKQDEPNFRRRVAATERLRHRVLAHGTLLSIVVRFLRRHVLFPEFNFPQIAATSLPDIERVAEQARLHWGLDLDAPISNVGRVLENAGVVLVRADLETATKVDALSRFGDVSVVVLNTAKGSPSRTLFDTAHEAGHGVMHRGVHRVGLAEREAEADRFAGAFLLPRAAFAREFLGAGRSDWEFLLELKRRWRVSLQAMIVRAYQLDLIDAAEYQIRYRYLARRGWRTAEPEEPAPEEPELLQLAVERYVADTGKSVVDLAHEIRWSPALFTAVTGLVAESPQATDVVSLPRYRERLAAAQT